MKPISVCARPRRVRIQRLRERHSNSITGLLHPLLSLFFSESRYYKRTLSAPVILRDTIPKKPASYGSKSNPFPFELNITYKNTPSDPDHHTFTVPSHTI